MKANWPGNRSAPVAIETLETRQLLSTASLPVSLHVNAGGPAVVDSIARSFEADNGFTGGTVGTQTAIGANGRPADPIFNSFRHGASFSFSKPIANGHYALFLEFADTAVTPAGRRFNVVGEGQPLLTNFDPTGAGVGVASVRSFDINIADETIDLQFTGTVGNAIVSGIVLVPTDIPPEAQPYSWASLSDSARRVTSANSLRQIGLGIVFYQNENKGQFPADLLQVYKSTLDRATAFASPRTDTSLPRGELSYEESVAWVGAREDFVYVGANLDPRQIQPDDVIAYESPARVAGDLHVLYADGHVGLLARSAAGASLGFDPDAPPTGGAPFQTTLPADSRYLQSQVNLRGIGTSLLTWANQNRNRYAPTPGDLVYTGAEASWFVNPRDVTLTPPTGMTPDQAKAFVNASTDYRYVAANRSGSESPANVLVYEKPSQFSDGISFLFNDGSAQFREQRWAMETLRRTSIRYAIGGQPATEPIAEIAGPKLLKEGESVLLQGAGLPIEVPSPATGFLPVPIVGYEWDLNYDGATFDVDATGRTTTFSANGIDGLSTRTVAMRVTDAQGQTSPIATATLNVVNAAPTVAGFVATPAAPLARTINMVFVNSTDPSAADKAAGFRYSFDFNNDGDFTDPGDARDIASWSSLHTFPTIGTFDVRGRITDKDGGYTEYVTTVTVPQTFALQAEAAVLSGGTVKSTQWAGYTGAGYADYAGGNSAVQWTVTGVAATATGAGKLEFRYANGSTGNRPTTIFVNNVNVGTLPFAPTGAWNKWATVALNTTLPAGTVTVRAVAGSAGGANVDQLAITAGTLITPPAPTTIVYQAEAAKRGGSTVSTEHAGYTGAGYVDYGGNGSYVEFTVNRATTGAVSFAVRYANGGTAARPLTLYVNGTAAGTLTFGPTGGWATWSTATLAGSLLAGNNVVRLVAGVAGGPNVDQLSVTGV